MSKAFEMQSWVDRDVYAREEEVIDIAHDFIELRGLSDGTIEAKVYPRELRATLTEQGFDLDHLEVLDVQERIINEAQRNYDADIFEGEEHARELFEEHVRKYIDWENFDTTLPLDTRASEKFSEIADTVSFMWESVHRETKTYSEQDVLDAIRRLQAAENEKEEYGRSPTAKAEVRRKKIAKQALHRLRTQEER